MGNTCCCASLRDKIDVEYKTLAKKQKEQQELLEKQHKKQAHGIASENNNEHSTPNDGHVNENDPIDLVPKSMPKELRKRRNSSDCEEEKEDLFQIDNENDLNCSANDQTMSTIHNKQNNKAQKNQKPPLMKKLDLLNVQKSSESPLKRKLTALYETQSANGGDPANQSARNSSSRRSNNKRSEVDLKLQQMQQSSNAASLSRRSFQGQDGNGDDDGASSYDEGDNGTLVICRGKRHGDTLLQFSDKDTLEKHLAKKLNRLSSFTAVDCCDKVLSYEASDYLADLIKERGSSPLVKVDFQRTFCGENVEEEEVAQSISTLLDALEINGVKELSFGENDFSVPSADRLARSLTQTSFQQLKVLNLSSCILRDKTINIVQGLIQSKIRLTKLYLQDNSMESEGSEAVTEYLQKIDTLEEIDISKNQIMNEDMTAVLKAIKLSAAQLRVLRISQNMLDSKAITELVQILALATSLERLDISETNIDKVVSQKRVILTLSQSKLAKSMKELLWNQDLSVDKVAIQAINDFLKAMPKLKLLEIQGPIHKKSMRDELRSRAKIQGVDLVLTTPDEQSESESEVSEISEEQASSETSEVDL